MNRVTIAGTLDFAGADVAQVLLGAGDLIAAAYAEAGCIHYAWTVDVLAPGRAWVFEEWESVETLSAHLAAAPYLRMSAYLAKAGLTGADVNKYRVDRKEPVYDDLGVPRGDFFTG